jgi:hypothetical protein
MSALKKGTGSQGVAPDSSAYPWELPKVVLTTEDEYRLNAETRVDTLETVDTLIGFGTDRGTARIAELLLNAGLEDSPQDEYQLESEAGNRGVSPASAELSLWLPGSIGYYY